jgi:OHCU decarboxylase
MTEDEHANHLIPRPSMLDRATFIARFGPIYESSPWIAEAAWEAGLTEREDSVDGLHRLLETVVSDASREARLRLIRAHPDLAGRAAVAGELTEASRGEQKSAGLDRCTREEFQCLQELNAAYRDRFGFPFILAVKGKSPREIIQAFEQRLGNDEATEFRTALEQIHRIALLRLREISATSERARSSGA